jgi:hypothetical protein
MRGRSRGGHVRCRDPGCGTARKKPWIQENGVRRRQVRGGMQRFFSWTHRSHARMKNPPCNMHGTCACTRQTRFSRKKTSPWMAKTPACMAKTPACMRKNSCRTHTDAAWTRRIREWMKSIRACTRKISAWMRELFYRTIPFSCRTIRPLVRVQKPKVRGLYSPASCPGEKAGTFFPSGWRIRREDRSRDPFPYQSADAVRRLRRIAWMETASTTTRCGESWKRRTCVNCVKGEDAILLTVATAYVASGGNFRGFRTPASPCVAAKAMAMRRDRRMLRAGLVAAVSSGNRSLALLGMTWSSG